MSSQQQTRTPADDIRITQTEYPKGWKVARYDAKGRLGPARWFPNLTLARAHAVELHAEDLNRMLGERWP